MNEITNFKETMTSLEISEVTGKQHQHILRDIDGLIEQGLDASNFGLTSYIDKSNREQRMYRLTKKGCLILASGYNALLRERIINRWKELEMAHRANTPALPTTYKEALKELLAKVEENETLALENKQQADKIEQDAPKVNFANALTSSTDTILVRELAKILKQNGINIGGNRLWDWFRNNGYICKGKCEPTQLAMEQKLFVVITRTIENGSSTPIVSRTTKVTAKGQMYFINKLLSQKDADDKPF